MKLRPEELWLLGLDTKETVDIGDGHKNWLFNSFRGPIFDARPVAGSAAPAKTHLLLPIGLLTAFYERFAAANPSGVVVAETNELDDLEFWPDISEDERSRLYDAGEVGWDVFNDRIPPHGRDPIRRYLPELFEPAVMQQILSDPTLDFSWGRSNQPDGNAFWSDEHHYRWSDWWRDAPTLGATAGARPSGTSN